MSTTLVFPPRNSSNLQLRPKKNIVVIGQITIGKTGASTFVEVSPGLEIIEIDNVLIGETTIETTWIDFVVLVETTVKEPGIGGYIEIVSDINSILSRRLFSA
jgi:hypothetical protein